ncbi:MAG: phosphatase PAP2 family protein [Proteobacteria bacterium]|nr:phosphatase PAP2 family protein [Pseudomonadota bacterium]
MPIFLSQLFLIILFSISSAQAKSYFSADKIPPDLLDKPLGQNSAEYKSEIEQIIKLQKHVSRAEIEKAQSEAQLSIELMTKAVDPKLSPQNFPQLYNLLERSFDTMISVNDDAKKYWNTKRPYLVDKRIKLLVSPANNPAYPSGHTSASYILAKILGLLIEKRSADFQKRADEIANHRVVSGMHFPNDLKGGRQLALLVLGGLLQNNEFLVDLEKAKKELRAAEAAEIKRQIK